MGGNKSQKHNFKHHHHRHHHHHHYPSASGSLSLLASGGGVGAGQGPQQPRTVQERLEQSRREAHRPRSSTEAVQRAGVLTALATAPTKPIETRELLQLPETVPIRSRPGQYQLQQQQQQQQQHDGLWRRDGIAGAERGRGAMTVRMRNLPPAGPPAPRSWGLEQSRFAPRRNGTSSLETRASSIHNSHTGLVGGGTGDRHTELDGGFSKITLLQDRKLESHRLPVPGSLKCFALKSLARNWTAMRQDLRSEDFADLEAGTKSALWAYMVHLGVPLGKQDLSILFGDHRSWDLQRLDLTRIVGYTLSAKEFSKFLARPYRMSWQHKDNAQASGHAPDSAILNETWEDAVNEQQALAIPRAVGSTVFLQLTHLSLAKPGASANWSDLLEVAPKLRLLTHFSLAYWPIPLLRRDMSMQASEWQGHTSSPLSLNIMYGQPQPDWDESAYVLRTLSKATYSLQWLDLEGCNAWLPALAVHAAEQRTDARESRRHTSSASASSSSSASSDEDAFWRDGVATQAKGPDWNGSWSKLKYVHIAQSWFPTNINLNLTRPATLIRNQVVAYLKDQDQHHSSRPPEAGLHPLDVERYCLQFVGWEAQELKDREVVKKIRDQLRRFVVFDHGWQPVVNLVTAADKVHDKT